jgi:S1-C subfamily serine protease
MKLLLAALLLTGCVASPEPAYASRDTSHRLESLEGGVCSGTAVGRRTVLSAAHCFKKGQQIVLIDGTAVGILSIELDGNDHALVVVTMLFPAVAKRGPEPKVGDKVHWIGQPMGLKNVYGEGLMVGEYESRLLIDGQVWFGVSGAGLHNERGELVGVVSGILGQQIYKLGFAYPLAFSDKQWAAVK